MYNSVLVFKNASARLQQYQIWTQYGKSSINNQSNAFCYSSIKPVQRSTYIRRNKTANQCAC